MLHADLCSWRRLKLHAHTPESKLALFVCARKPLPRIPRTRPHGSGAVPYGLFYTRADGSSRFRRTRLQPLHGGGASLTVRHHAGAGANEAGTSLVFRTMFWLRGPPIGCHLAAVRAALRVPPHSSYSYRLSRLEFLFFVVRTQCFTRCARASPVF